MTPAELTAKADELQIIAAQITGETSMDEISAWLVWADIPRREWTSALNHSDAPIDVATVGLILAKAAMLRRKARTEEELDFHFYEEEAGVLL